MHSLFGEKLGHHRGNRNRCCRKAASAHLAGGAASHICYCSVSSRPKCRGDLGNGPRRHGDVLGARKGPTTERDLIKVGGQVARCRSREKLTTNPGFSNSGNRIRYNCLPNPVLTGNPAFVANNSGRIQMPSHPNSRHFNTDQASLFKLHVYNKESLHVVYHNHLESIGT